MSRAPRALAALLGLALVVAACGSDDDTPEATGSDGSTDTTAAGGAADGDLTVGFIYVGPKDDFGYNQAA
ncbi:MAG: hypothetical protein ACRDZU_13915, partial [Acidimicrobiales bacterium]